MMQKTLKNNRYNKYEKGKRIKVVSFKSHLLVKELSKKMENTTIFIEMINFDNKFFNIYNESENILDNIYLNDNSVNITYKELEILIKTYMAYIDNNKIKYNYKKLYEIYYKKDNHDNIFNDKLYRIITNNDKRGIINELVGLLLYDGHNQNR